MNNQELDDLFRSTLSSEGFPVDEQAWAAAEAMIDSQSAKPRRPLGGWLIWGGATLLAGGLAFMLWSNPEPHLKQTGQQQALASTDSTPAPAVAEAIELAVEEQLETRPASTMDEATDETAVNAPTAAPEPTASNTPDAPIDLAQQDQSASTSTPTPNIAPQTTASDDASDAIATTDSSDQTDETNEPDEAQPAPTDFTLATVADNANAKPADESTDESQQDVLTTNPSDQTDRANPPDEAQPASADFVLPSLADNSNTQAMEGTNDDSPQDVISKVPANDDAIAAVNQTPSANNSTADDESATAPSEEDVAPSDALDADEPLAAVLSREEVEHMPLFNRVHESNLVEPDEYPVPTGVSRISWGWMMGFGPSVARSSSGEQPLQSSISLAFGPRVHYALGKQLSLGSGLHYFSRDGWQTSKSYISETYSFGVERETTVIETQSLHFAEIPLYVQYHFEGLRAAVGVSGSYLLGTRSSVDSQQSNYLSLLGSETDKSWGYTKGFNRMDYGLIGAIDVALSTRLYLGVQYNYGLRDLSRNSYYNNNRNDRNQSLRIRFDYRLSR